MEKLMVKTKIAVKPQKWIFQFGFQFSTPKSTAKRWHWKKSPKNIDFFVVKSHGSVIHCSRKLKIAVKPSKKLIFTFRFLFSTPSSTAKKRWDEKNIDFFDYWFVCCNYCLLALLAGPILYYLLAYDAHWSLSRPAAAMLQCCSCDSPAITS